jgi:outer membrane lipoprotein-sorting protein
MKKNKELKLFLHLNKHWFYLYTIFILCSILIISCSAPKPREESFNVYDIITSINRTSETIKSLKGNGNISVESATDGGQSGNFRVSILKPDSVFLNVTGPFGINVAKALILRDTFLFHYAFDNVVVTGKTSDKNLSELIKITVGFDEIIDIISCTPSFIREGDIVPQVDANFEDNEIVLIYQNGTGDIVKYFINLKNRYISKRTTYSGSGKIIKEERYQNYYQKDGMWLPRSIKVSLPTEGQALSLYFERHEINSKDLNFDFTIPKNTKVIQW